MIEAKLDRNSPVIKKVVKRYKTLFQQMKSCGEGKDYSEEMMWDNLRRAICINGIFLEPVDFKEPLIIRWVRNYFKVFYHSHWYYAVKFFRTPQNDVIAHVVDACYEGQYHYHRTQRPYPIKESTLRRIITEIIYRILNN